MKLRFLIPAAVSLLLPACASEVLGEPESEQSDAVSATQEDLASSTTQFNAFYLPASREALCLFADGSTYRGAATNRDAAYLSCQRRAVDAAPGSFDARVGQLRAANGTCTTGLIVDGVWRSQRVSACNTSIDGRARSGPWYSGNLGSQAGFSWWWAGCFGLGVLDPSGGLTGACLNVVVSRL